MKRIFQTLILIFMGLGIFSCNENKTAKEEQKVSPISNEVVEGTIKSLLDKNKEAEEQMLRKGVEQLAFLWRDSDGTTADFIRFCEENYVSSPEERKVLFLRLDRYFEVIWGNFLKMEVELNEPNHMCIGELQEVDLQFAAFNPRSHLTEDLYANKIAFMVALNFPEVKLEDKNKLGAEWTSLQWAYARLGDVFTARVPSELLQKHSEVTTKADAYISSYNIFMGHVIGKDGKTHFPEDMKLISHWNLRDELKSNYAEENGIMKQEMIYDVMKHIIYQTIPSEVINSPDYEWAIADNKLYKEGKEVDFKSEPNTRYQYLLDNFNATKAMDMYYPTYPDYIQRRFSGGMEIPQEEVKKIFIELISSPEIKGLAAIIKNNLGRELRPYDIWYNGFKAKSSLSETELNKITQKKYPNPKAFEADIARMLKDLAFSPEQAVFIASKIQVDGSRGAGHAWGAEMKSEKARLRTRIDSTGMNYKGYNIAVHEFGHNVEQTISLHDVDYYMIHGVPNTALTEALAFIFQKRDLELLGLEEKNDAKMHYMALDNLWSCYEIMGVSLVDMAVWEWMYAHPEANAEDLKIAVIDIAKDVWNSYFAEVFGVKDEPILAIYSHMIDNPLYLSAYPIGHLADFQIEQSLEAKVFADEINRIYSVGKLTPKHWMIKAVGQQLSPKPLLKASREAIDFLKK